MRGIPFAIFYKDKRKNTDYHFGILHAALKSSSQTILQVQRKGVEDRASAVVYYLDLASGFPMKLLLTSVFSLMVMSFAQAQIPVISTVVPNSAAPGTLVTINGFHFGETPASNDVFFGAVKAFISNASTTQLDVIVPIGATYENVVVQTGGLTTYSPLPFNPLFNGERILRQSSFQKMMDFTNASGARNFVADIDVDGKGDLIVAGGYGKFYVYRNVSSTGIIEASSFSGPVEFSASPNLLSESKVADIDGDGRPDIIGVIYGDRVVVFRNASVPGTINSSSFDTPVIFTTGLGTNPNDIVIGDLDLDGKPEIVTGNYQGGISILKNQTSLGGISANSFATPVNMVTDGTTFSVAIADIDRDGKPEIIGANSVEHTISVFHNTSTIGTIDNNSFAGKVSFSTGPDSRPVFVSASDLDSDGFIDLAVVNYGTDNVSLFRNVSETGTISSSSFEQAQYIQTGNGPYHIVFGDLDGDGKGDLIVANNQSNTFSIIRNHASPGSLSAQSFSPKVDFTTLIGPAFISVADLDRDLQPDIVVTHFSVRTASIYKNLIPIRGPVPVINSFDPPFGSSETKMTLTGTGFDPDPRNNFVTVNGIPTPTISSTTTDLIFRVPLGASSGRISVTVGEQTATSNSDLIIAQPPVIESFSPVMGEVGSDVIITGSQFVSTVSGNIVFFGDTRASVIAASTTQLTVRVPKGASFKPISVEVNGLIAYSARPFTVTFSSARVSNLSVFGDAVTVPATPNSNPQQVITVDFDNDGKTDIATVNISNHTVSLFRNIHNTGDFRTTSFAAPLSFTTGEKPVCIASADLDGDGRIDLVIGNNESESVSVFKNTSNIGEISLADKIDIKMPGSPAAMAIGDIDGNGRLDIVVSMDYRVVVVKNLQNVGSITKDSFELTASIYFGRYASSIAVGDLDEDNRPDVVVLHTYDNIISVLRNTSIAGAISFQARINFTLSSTNYTGTVSLGDIDGDLKSDIVAGANIFRNTSMIGLITMDERFDLGGSARVLMADIDGDGKIELAWYHQSNGFSYVRNRSVAGTINSDSFVSSVWFSLNSYAGESHGAAIADLNGDSKPDIILLDYLNSKLVLVQNTIHPPLDPTPEAPTIIGFSPRYGSIGTEVTIEGNNFNPTVDNNTVYFGATKARTIFASQSKLVVEVPVGATFSPLIVISSGLTAQSNDAFVITFPGGSLHSARYEEPVELSGKPGVNWLNDVMIHDVDVDGKPDIVAMKGRGFSVLRNISNSGSITRTSFAPEINFGVDQSDFYASNIAIGDIDGDAKPEVVVSGNGVYIFKNTTVPGKIDASSFAASSVFNSNHKLPRGVELGDVDGDGKIDLIGYYGDYIAIMRNTTEYGVISENSFDAVELFFSGKTVYGGRNDCVRVADFDGDGKIDIAVTNYEYHFISLFRNVSTVGRITPATLSARIDIPTGDFPVDFIVRDFDGDDKPDIITRNSKNISIIRNNSIPGVMSSNSFEPHITLADERSTYSLTDMDVADIDGDSRPDIIAFYRWITYSLPYSSQHLIKITRNESNQGSLLRSDLKTKQTYNTRNEYSDGLGVGDLNGDGMPEFVANVGGEKMVVIQVNDTLAPSIFNFFPKSGPSGAAVHITGKNFEPNSTVAFNGLNATIVSRDSQNIYAVVPNGATPGRISITTSGNQVSTADEFTVIRQPFPQSYQETKRITTHYNLFNVSDGISFSNNTGIIGNPYEDIAVIFNADAAGEQQSERLTGKYPPDIYQSPRFGTSVAIVGNVAVITAQVDQGGSVLFFEKDETGKWLQKQKLSKSGYLGGSVTFDGKTVAVSADWSAGIINGSYYNRGSVHLIERNAQGIWQFVQSIQPLNGHDQDYFGQSIAIRKNLLVVGSPKDDYDETNGNFRQDAGSVSVYERNESGTWVFRQKISSPGRELLGFFGNAIAVTEGTIVVTATGNGPNKISSSGAAYVYKKTDAGDWALRQTLVASNQSYYQYFGCDVAISDKLIAVGCHTEDQDEGNKNDLGNAGAVYLFREDQSGQWVHHQKLCASNRAANKLFGSSVAIDNNTIAVTDRENVDVFVFQQVDIIPQPILIDQMIIFNKLPSKKYLDNPFVLSASATSDLPTLYASSNPDIATINGNTVAIHKPGSVGITASQDGNSKFKPATPVTQLLKIEKADQNITFEPLPSVVESSAALTLNAESSSGLTVAFTSSATSVATVVGNQLRIENGGSTIIEATQNGDVNFSPAQPVSRSLTVMPRIVTGLDDINETPFWIYPNPSSGNFRIVKPADFSRCLSIEVYNSLGEQVYETIETVWEDAEVSINVAAGIYTVQIRDVNSPSKEKRSKVHVQ
jgi:FG-GAP-like repeat/IPT/TIG domain/FG-GAP repeat/Secretion system C-terminal sorting domain